MSYLLESPVAVGSLGLLVVAFGLFAHQQTRSRATMAVLIGCLLLASGAFAFERMWVTPQEAIRAVVGELFTAIEANDLPRVLALIDPQATDVCADAETLMPMFNVQNAGPGHTRVTLLSEDSATVSHKPLIKAQHKASGAIAAYFDDLTITYVRRGDRWLVESYTPAQDWREGASGIGR